MENVLTKLMKSTSEGSFACENSVMREKMLTHRFLWNVYAAFWWYEDNSLEILMPEVDSAGYDVVLVKNGIPVFIQLKSTQSQSSSGNITVNKKLAQKERWAIILQQIGPDSITYRVQTGANLEDNELANRPGTHKKRHDTVNTKKSDYHTQYTDNQIWEMIEEIFANNR